MELFLILSEICFLILLMTTVCGSLTCYQCTNLEILADGSDMVKSAFSGTSDPSCGSYPSTINAKVCPAGYICGSFTGDVAQVVVVGKIEAKVHVRTCIRGTEGTVNECRKQGEVYDEINQVLRSLGDGEYKNNWNIVGQACSCGSDFCLPDCASGIQIASMCIKYWMLAIGVIGFLAITLPILWKLSLLLRMFLVTQ